MRLPKAQAQHRVEQLPDLYAFFDFLKKNYSDARREKTGRPLGQIEQLQLYNAHGPAFSKPATLHIHRIGWYTKLELVSSDAKFPVLVLLHAHNGFEDWKDFRACEKRYAHVTALGEHA